ncbi:MAG: DsrE family protein [Gammaproteobacteria bacterium]
MQLIRVGRIAIASAVAICFVATAAAASVPGNWNPPPGFWSTPTIAGYGRIHYESRFAYQPQPDQFYKIVVALTAGAKHPSQVDPALDHLARIVNLYVAAGVPLTHLKFVGIAYGAATPAMMDNAHYRARFGVDNPNLKLIGELRKAGVVVTVCAQAVAEHHINYAWVSKEVPISLSALTTVTVLEHDGYTLMQE